MIRCENRGDAHALRQALLYIEGLVNVSAANVPRMLEDADGIAAELRACVDPSLVPPLSEKLVGR